MGGRWAIAVMIDGVRVELTDRDVDILRALADGELNHQIAGLYGLTLATVRHRISELYSKLECDSRVRLARFYWAEVEPLIREEMRRG